MTNIAHIRKVDDKWEIQSLEEHSSNVAELSSGFANAFGMGSWGKVIGLLHDIGKEQKDFQTYIKKLSGMCPELKVYNHPAHAYVGALIAKKLFPSLYPLMANTIAGHHRGLYDDGELKEVMKSEIPNDVKVQVLNNTLSLPKSPKDYKPYDLHHVIRMLFSCLVDADYLDTESFMRPEQSALRGGKATMKELDDKLKSYLQELKQKSPDTPVNRIRNYVQEQCKKESNADAGFFSLTVPTGGGKTLSSVLWALRHAIRNDLNRIIIAIPYTSIITQTARVLKSVFGEENVLEHHSNVDYSEKDDTRLANEMRLATENWDYPIIVTTNVQLFESLFSNVASDCRKLHNITKSVLILDEVQTLPMEFLHPIIDTLDTLKRILGTSVLFTTASQPRVSGEIKGANPFVSFSGLSNVHEIIPSEAKLYDKLRRVELKFDDKKQGYDDIANRLSQYDRVLCIVNTRKDAKEIFSRLPKEGITLHLSRMMCPSHIQCTIQSIIHALKDDSIKVVRVVSTQLVEAGVDIDFPIVFRQEAGLDSILQAAGRCNREGKLKIGTTHVFNLQKEHALPRGFISQTNNARVNMGHDYDWFSPDAMNDYFNQLYCRIENFDKAQIGKLLYRKELNFETASQQFQLIQDETTSVIVNWRKGKTADLLEQVKSNGITYSLMKQLAQYSVNVRNNDMKKLREAGAIDEILENVFVIKDTAFYDDNVGLIINNHWLEETLIV